MLPAVGGLCSALISITAHPAVGRPRLVIIQGIQGFAPHDRTTAWRWGLAERQKKVPKGLHGT